MRARQSRGRGSIPRFIHQRLGLDPIGLAHASPSTQRRARGSEPVKAEAVDQFLALSTSALALIQGIMARSFSPTSSIGCWASLARIALNEVWLTRFSSIQSRVNLPD